MQPVENFDRLLFAACTTNTAPAAAARQQQYQTEFTAALRAGDYQLALKLFKEFGNPNLRALKEVQTLKAFTEFADAAGYGIFTSSAQEFIYPAWEYAGTRKGLDSSAESGILKLSDILIGRSLGAKAKNYDIELPNKEIIHLTEETRVKNVHVIAGKGRNRQIDIVTSLVEKFPGTKEAEWQRVKGVGYVDYHGENYKADLHWYEEPSVGRVGWKVKPDADGNWFIDED